MSDLTISSLGLILLMVPVLVHGIEVLYPTQARWVVNWVLPFFGPGLPNRSRSLGLDEQMAMMDAAIQAAPADKERAGGDYVFLLMFEQRQGALCFAASALGAIYGLTLAIADRNALHLMFAAIAALMMLVNANQAGVPFFGNHPRVSTNGKHVGIVFTAFWAAATVLNVLGFTYAVA